MLKMAIARNELKTMLLCTGSNPNVIIWNGTTDPPELRFYFAVFSRRFLITSVNRISPHQNVGITEVIIHSCGIERAEAKLAQHDY